MMTENLDRVPTLWRNHLKKKGKRNRSAIYSRTPKGDRCGEKEDETE